MRHNNYEQNGMQHKCTLKYIYICSLLNKSETLFGFSLMYSHKKKKKCLYNEN